MAFGGREEAEAGFASGGGGSSGQASSGNSSGQASSNNNNPFSFLGNAVKSMISGTPPTNVKTVSSSQNFKQGNLPTGYTVSKSGNTVYGKYNPNLASARELAENRDTGISDEMAFRGAVAGINPNTGTMWSGASKDGTLDRFTNTMMTPQRAAQNTSRTDRYKAQSDLALSGLLTPEQREINRQESLFNLDLDGDGSIWSSTHDDGTVYGMSNKAIYDPSITDPAYRGIPSRYATGSQTTINNLPISGSYQGQKTSDDRMLANEIASWVMPGAGIVRGVNWAKGKLAPKVAETQDIRANTGIMTNDEITALANSAINKAEPAFNYNTKPVTTIKLDDLETSSNFENFTGQDPYGNNMYSNNPIVGYQMDGRTPIYADDPNANQVPYMNVYP